MWLDMIHIPGNDDETSVGDEGLFELFEGAGAAVSLVEMNAIAESNAESNSEGGTVTPGNGEESGTIDLEEWALTYFQDYLPEIESWYSDVLASEVDWLQRVAAAAEQGDVSEQPLFVPEVPLIPGIGVEVIKQAFAINPVVGVLLVLVFLAAYFGLPAVKEWLKRKIQGQECCDKLIQAVEDLQYNNEELHLSGSDAVIQLKGKYAQKGK